MNKNDLSPEKQKELIKVLQVRFGKNMIRHQGLSWPKIQTKLDILSNKLWSLSEMERTGGEPDVIDFDKKSDEYIFYDCATESPKGRRSLCYDRAALELRKEFKPKDTVIDLCVNMGVDLLTEEQYRKLQKLDVFDTKTSSWLKTPPEIRKLGGAIFADRRYDHIFVYHNGADSYYGSRGFRGLIKI
jgi:hypothetical protein